MTPDGSATPVVQSPLLSWTFMQILLALAGARPALVAALRRRPPSWSWISKLPAPKHGRTALHVSRSALRRVLVIANADVEPPSGRKVSVADVTGAPAIAGRTGTLMGTGAHPSSKRDGIVEPMLRNHSSVGSN